MINAFISKIYKNLNEFESISLKFEDGTVYFYDRPTKSLEIRQNDEEHFLKVNIDFQRIIDNNIENIIYISIVEDGKQIFKMDLTN